MDLFTGLHQKQVETGSEHYTVTCSTWSMTCLWTYLRSHNLEGLEAHLETYLNHKPGQEQEAGSRIQEDRIQEDRMKEDRAVSPQIQMMRDQHTG